MVDGFGLSYLTPANISGLSGPRTTEQVNYDIARRFPPAIAEQYNKIANQGIYGTQGVQQIQSAISMARMLKLRNLAKSRGAMRRLGPRSGALYKSNLNSIYAPALASEAESLANLTADNLRSRSSVGLAGLQDLLSLAAGQYAQTSSIDRQKPSTFEKIAGGLAGLATAAGGLF